ncbi:MAG: LytTR family DNA-binding domain-containing protein [Bacteroidota bacterium]
MRNIPWAIWKKQLIYATGIGLFVGLFLVFFQPFGMRLNSLNQYLLVGSFGLVNFVFALLLGLIEFQIWGEKGAGSKGKTARNLWLVAMLLGVLIVNVSYSVWMNMGSISMPHILYMIPNVLAIALFPIAYDLIRRMGRGFGSTAKVTPASLVSDQTILLQSPNGKEQLKFAPSQLLYISSADNYSLIYLHTEAESERHILRGSLKAIAEQIDHPDIMRVHRSHIVNLQQVRKWSSHSGGVALHLFGQAETLPVSPKYKDLVLSQLTKAS